MNVKMAVKTNAMRILDKAKISYVLKEYPLNGLEPAVDVTEYLGITRDDLFKTLVTTDLHGGYYVFCIQSSRELDLKKAASTVGVKKIEMLKQKDLLKLTGYIHGGCSPIGMKKLFPTVVDSRALDKDKIVISGGKVGVLIEIDPHILESTAKARYASVIK